MGLVSLIKEDYKKKKKRDRRAPTANRKRKRRNYTDEKLLETKIKGALKKAGLI